MIGVQNSAAMAGAAVLSKERPKYKRQDGKIFLPAIAAMLGSVLAGTRKMKVVFKGGATTASTNGSTVFLPVFVREGNDTSADVLRCFLAHEILGHVFNTDFNALKQWAASEKPNPFLFGLWNIIEDGRIEKAAWPAFPACKTILEKGVAVLKDMKFFGPEEADPDAHPSRIVSTLLMRTIRGDFLNQPVDSASIKKVAAMVFGSDVRDKIIDLAMTGVSAGPGIEKTADTIQAAKTIVDYLKEVEEDRKKKEAERQKKKDAQERQQNQSQDSQQDQEDSGQDRENSDQDQEDSDRDQSGAGGSAAQEDCGNGNDDGSESQADEDDDTGEDGDSQTITEALNGDENDVGPTDMAEGAQKSGILPKDRANQQSRTQKMLTDTSDAECVARSGVQTKNVYSPSMESMGEAQKLAARLEQLLQSKVGKATRLGDDGRLDGRRLVHAVMGGQKVFQLRGRERDGLNTAISLILDQSGSMSANNHMNIALDACYAMASSMGKFEQQGLAFSVVSFYDSMSVLKDWERPWASSRNNLSVVKPRGGTRFQPTLLECCKDLATRKEHRKIAFFITDGDIGTEAKSVLATIQREGIEIRCVMIESGGSVKNCESLFEQAGIEHWALASKPSDIAPAIFNCLQGAF